MRVEGEQRELFHLSIHFPKCLHQPEQSQVKASSQLLHLGHPIAGDQGLRPSDASKAPYQEAGLEVEKLEFESALCSIGIASCDVTCCNTTRILHIYNIKKLFKVYAISRKRRARILTGNTLHPHGSLGVLPSEHCEVFQSRIMGWGPVQWRSG